MPLTRLRGCQEGKRLRETSSNQQTATRSPSERPPASGDASVNELSPHAFADSWGLEQVRG